MLEHGRLYGHKILRVRYTTYDVRRAEDVIHIASDQSNVMFINPDFEPNSCQHHPFRYAKVLGIYHARPYLPGTRVDGARPARVDFLWVHWYDVIHHSRSLKLDRVQLRPVQFHDVFGFVDPAEVIRAAHLPPQFCKGFTSNLYPRWFKGRFWRYYYVNRYALRPTSSLSTLTGPNTGFPIAICLCDFYGDLR
jgi:hypothetical protein